MSDLNWKTFTMIEVYVENNVTIKRSTTCFLGFFYRKFEFSHSFLRVLRQWVSSSVWAWAAWARGWSDPGWGVSGFEPDGALRPLCRLRVLYQLTLRSTSRPNRLGGWALDLGMGARSCVSCCAQAVPSPHPALPAPPSSDISCPNRFGFFGLGMGLGF
jgi:hypothetical protein